MSRAVWQATIADFAGNIVPGATVRVTDAETSALVPLFSVLEGAGSLSNPFAADDNGFARFYVESGRFNILANFGASTREWVDVEIGGSSAPTLAELLEILSQSGGAEAAGDFLINVTGAGLEAANFTELVRAVANVPTLRGASFIGYNSAIRVPVNDVSVPVAFDATISKVIVLTQGGTGSCVLDVWKDSFASYPPTSSDSICGGNKPTIAAAKTFQDSTLTSWGTTVSAGDVLSFHLQSNSTFTAVAIFLVLTPSGAQASDGYTDARVVDIVEDILADGGITVVGSTYTVQANGSSGPVNLWSLIGRPAGAVTVNYSTPAGGMASNQPGVPALDLRGFTSGSTVNVTALGAVDGCPGEGGDGGAVSSSFGEDGGSGRRGISGTGPQPGRAGGPAIVGPGTGITFTLSALGGFVRGGGGGGGGGGVSVDFTGDSNEGSGGGGGAGAGGARGGRGGIALGATTSAPATATAAGGGDSTGGLSGAAGSGGSGAGNGSGTGGTGGAGGDWGTAGSAGASPTTYDRDFAGASGGAAGKAIDLNGGSVTITDGNDSTHIKGSVS